MTQFLYYIFSREDLDSPLKVDWISTSQEAWTIQMKSMGVKAASGLHAVGYFRIADDADHFEAALVQLDIERAALAKKFFPGQCLVENRPGEALKMTVEKSESPHLGKIKVSLFQLDREAMEWKFAMTTYPSKEPFATKWNLDHLYRSWGLWEPGMAPNFKEGDGMGGL